MSSSSVPAEPAGEFAEGEGEGEALDKLDGSQDEYRAGEALPPRHFGISERISCLRDRH